MPASPAACWQGEPVSVPNGAHVHKRLICNDLLSFATCGVSCPTIEQCQGQSRCLYLVASGGRSFATPSTEWTALDGAFRRFAFAARSRPPASRSRWPAALQGDFRPHLGQRVSGGVAAENGRGDLARGGAVRQAMPNPASRRRQGPAPRRPYAGPSRRPSLYDSICVRLRPVHIMSTLPPSSRAETTALSS